MTNVPSIRKVKVISPAAASPRGQGKSPVALVAYMIATDPARELPACNAWEKAWLGAAIRLASRRMAKRLLPADPTYSQWTDLFSGDPDYQTVGADVFRFEYMYLLKSSATTGTSAPSHLSITPWDTTYVTPKHTSLNGFADVSAIVVTIAILDSASRKLVSNYTALTSSLVDAVDPASAGSYGVSTAPVWSSKVNSSAFATSTNIPRQAASQVRIYERYFYLNTLEESSP